LVELVFYFDRNVGKRFPYGIKHLDPPTDIRWHQREKFPNNMPDDAWLSLVGANGWIVLSQDRKFHINEAEIEAIRQHNVKCFYLPGADEPTWALARVFTKAFDSIVKVAQSESAPFVYDVGKSGRLKRIEF
jgi:hypothetical protein